MHLLTAMTSSFQQGTIASCIGQNPIPDEHLTKAFGWLGYSGDEILASIQPVMSGINYFRSGEMRIPINQVVFGVGSSSTDLYSVELFCGTAGLTACMRTWMPSSFGVDHQVTKPKAKVLKLDLLDPKSQKLVMQWITDPKCVWVHFGVPCDTSSRARNIRMSKRNHGPPPLRSSLFPNGLPPKYLSSLNLLRLRSANRLYHG